MVRTTKRRMVEWKAEGRIKKREGRKWKIGRMEKQRKVEQRRKNKKKGGYKERMNKKQEEGK